MALPNTIKTTKDVLQFVAHLYDVDNVSIHPDDPFRDVIRWQDQKPFYTVEQANFLDNLMVQARYVCQSKGLDIYGVFIAEFRKRKMEIICS